MPEIKYEKEDREFLISAKCYMCEGTLQTVYNEGIGSSCQTCNRTGLFFPELTDKCPGCLDCQSMYIAARDYAICYGSKRVSNITETKVLDLLLQTDKVELNSNPYSVELSSRVATTYVGNTIEEAAIAALADTIRERVNA